MARFVGKVGICCDRLGLFSKWFSHSEDIKSLKDIRNVEYMCVCVCVCVLA